MSFLGDAVNFVDKHVVKPVEHFVAPIVAPIAQVAAPIVKPVINFIPAVFHSVDTAATSISHGVVSGTSWLSHGFGSVANTAWTAATHPADTASTIWHSVVVPVAAPIVHAAETGATAVANTAVDIGKTAINVVEHPLDTVKDIATTAVHVGEQVATTVGTVAVDTAKQIATDATTAATTIAGAAVDAAHTVADGAQKLGGEVVDTAGAVLHDAGQAAADVGKAVATTAVDIGKGAVDAAGDALHTAAQVGGDVVHAAGDLATGHVGDAVNDVGAAGTDLAKGAAQVGADAVHTATTAAADVGNGVAQVASDVGQGAVDLAHGAVDAAGTALGVAGHLGQDFETAAGGLVKGAVDATVHLANGEISAVTGVLDVGAKTVGGPIAGFYDKVIDAYGDAAKTTLTHVGGAVDDGVGQLTHAGGDIVRAIGDGANTLGHDAGKLIEDAGKGDFTAIAHDLGQLGSDAGDAGKQFVDAEIEGAKALGAAASDVDKVLNGLDEAMGRALGGFVSAVGQTVGGDAGKAIDDFGKIVGDSTAAASDLASGDVAGAAKEAAKEIIAKGGDWASGELHDLTDKLGDAVGGKLGDGIKLAGGAADDALIDKAKDFLNDASTKGVDKVAGTDKPADTEPDLVDHSTDTPAAPDNRNIFQKGLDAAEDKGKELLDKGVDAIKHPDATLQKAADLLQDKLGGDKVTDAIHKVDGHTDAAKETLGTSHAALTANTDPEHLSQEGTTGGTHKVPGIIGSVNVSDQLGHSLHTETKDAASGHEAIHDVLAKLQDAAGTASQADAHPRYVDIDGGGFTNGPHTYYDTQTGKNFQQPDGKHPFGLGSTTDTTGSHSDPGSSHEAGSAIHTGNTGIASVVQTSLDPNDPSKIIVTGTPTGADLLPSSIHAATSGHGGSFWDQAAQSVSHHLGDGSGKGLSSSLNSILETISHDNGHGLNGLVHKLGATGLPHWVEMAEDHFAGHGGQGHSAGDAQPAHADFGGEHFAHLANAHLDLHASHAHS